ncbi:MAG: T9SS type A sorting domain-containing protein, partial [Bacteroidetes bacterium]
AVPGTYHLRVWTNYGNDLDLTNNEVGIIVESIVNTEADLRMQKVENPASNCFLGLEEPTVEIGFWGCDLLPAGTQISLSYRVNGGAPVTEVVEVPDTLRTGDTFTYTFIDPVNLIADGKYNFDVWVNYGPDGVITNDSLFDLRVHNPASMIRNEVLTFEYGDNSLDSMYTLRTASTSGEISTQAARTGANGYYITGGDIDLAFLFGEAQIPTNDNVWDVNAAFRSKQCICADLGGMQAAELWFDYRQNFSFYYLRKFGYNAPFGSSLRVLIDGEQISPTYKPITHSFDTWKSRKFDLADYLDRVVEICFETHTGISTALDTFGTKGDRIFLDNIAIVTPNVSSAGEPTLEPEWHVQPNPGSGLFTVTLFADEAQDVTVNVVDALGRSVRTLHQSVGAGNNQLPLHLETQPAGMYFVRLQVGAEQYVRRLIVQD